MSTRSNQLSPWQFLTKIRDTITAFQMLQEGNSILIGVSGGADSIVLLHVIVEIQKNLRLKLGIAHLNHGLRDKESDADADFVLSVAKEMGLPYFIEKKNVFHDHKHLRISLEEAGRDARYDFFNRVAEKEGYDKIAVGHHSDDNAEIILINLLRGSGPFGLRGIPPVRGKIIRPLIRSSRVEIQSYLEFNQWSYRIDSSNSDERFLRNKIRHHLIPLLRSHYNPNISQSLNRLGNLLSADEEWINQYVRAAVDQSMLQRNADSIFLSINKLRQLHIAAQRRVIRQSIFYAKGDLRRITYTLVDAVISLFTSDAGDVRLDLPDRIRIHKDKDQLIISRERKSLRSVELFEKTAYPACFQYTLSESDIFANPFIIREINASIRFRKLNRKDILHLKNAPSNSAFFDYDRLKFPLLIRNYRAGDRFVPLGMTGTQSLKKFFINNKFSMLKRARSPILLSGDNIIWVGGSRISDQSKVTPETKTILHAEIF